MENPIGLLTRDFQVHSKGTSTPPRLHIHSPCKLKVTSLPLPFSTSPHFQLGCKSAQIFLLRPPSYHSSTNDNIPTQWLPPLPPRPHLVLPVWYIATQTQAEPESNDRHTKTSLGNKHTATPGCNSKVSEGQEERHKGKVDDEEPSQAGNV